METVRVLGHDDNLMQVDAPSGLRYSVDRQGMLNMHPADAAAMVRAGGSLPSMAGVTRRGIGYRCRACGFGSFFATCRCGATCEREG